VNSVSVDVSCLLGKIVDQCVAAGSGHPKPAIWGAPKRVSVVFTDHAAGGADGIDILDLQAGKRLALKRLRKRAVSGPTAKIVGQHQQDMVRSSHAGGQYGEREGNSYATESQSRVQFHGYSSDMMHDTSLLKQG
jgi:hypothetical protein